MRILTLAIALLFLGQAVHAQTTSAPAVTVNTPAAGVGVTIDWADFKENFCVYGGAVYSLNSLICIGTQAHTCGRTEPDKIASWKSTGTCK
ncbi:MAG: hypothetical protein KF889_27770 [Alphaproteobacteria bacterium]|nr:hypothetical protein [Alphaproteobacteria bacterium]MCW5743754.1 hypothetical protein [Alphaproteobacteria bacterium]